MYEEYEEDDDFNKYSNLYLVGGIYVVNLRIKRFRYADTEDSAAHA